MISSEIYLVCEREIGGRNAERGALLVEASPGTLRFRFFTRTGSLVDDYSLYKTCP